MIFRLLLRLIRIVFPLWRLLWLICVISLWLLLWFISVVSLFRLFLWFICVTPYLSLLLRFVRIFVCWRINVGSSDNIRLFLPGFLFCCLSSVRLLLLLWLFVVVVSFFLFGLFLVLLDSIIRFIFFFSN